MPSAKAGGDRPFNNEWEAVQYLKNPPRPTKKNNSGRHRHHGLQHSRPSQHQETAQRQTSQDHRKNATHPREATGDEKNDEPQRRVVSTVKLTQAILEQAKAMQQDSWEAPSKHGGRGSRTNSKIMARFFEEEEEEFDNAETNGGTDILVEDEESVPQQKADDRRQSSKSKATKPRHNEAKRDVDDSRMFRRSGDVSAKSRNNIPDHQCQQVEKHKPNSRASISRSRSRHGSRTERAGVASNSPILSPILSTSKSPTVKTKLKSKGKKSHNRRKTPQNFDELDPDATGIHLKKLTVKQLCQWVSV